MQPAGLRFGRKCMPVKALRSAVLGTTLALAGPGPISQAQAPRGPSPSELRRSKRSSP
jgi:hypothetical protein